MRGSNAVTVCQPELERALKDSSADVRIAAAQAFAQFGSEREARPAVSLLAEWGNWKTHGLFSSLAALNALDAAGPRVAWVAESVKTLPTDGPAPDGRYASYVPRLVEELQAKLGSMAK